MTAKVKEFLIDNLAGGYNSFVNKTEVRDNESPDMLNMAFTGESAIKTRKGYIKYTTDEVVADKRVRGLFAYDTGSAIEIVQQAGTALEKGQGTAITGFTFTDDLDTNGCQVGNRLYLANGTDNLVYYDGSTATEITSNGNIGTLCIFWNQRLYMNNSTYPDRVYFGGAMAADGTVTNTGDFRSTTPAFGGYFSFGKGKIVTGFAKSGTSLYVFTQDAVYRIAPVADTGVSSALDHSEELVTNLCGCVAPRSIDQVENDIFFLWDDGVYSLGEQPNYVSIRTKDVSARVASLIKAIGDKSRASGIFYNHKYYLSFQEGTYNDHMLVYDTRYQAWTYWDGYNTGPMLSVRDYDGQTHLYFGSDNADAGYVYEAEQGTNDNGTAISWRYYTKCFDLGDFARHKIFMKGRVLFGNSYGVVTITSLINETEVVKIVQVGESSTYTDGWGSSPWGAKPFGLSYNTPDGTTLETLTNDFRFFDIDQEGQNVQFQFSGSTLDESTEIQKIQIKYLELPKEVEDSTRYIA